MPPSAGGFGDRRTNSQPLWPHGTLRRARLTTTVDFRTHLIFCALATLGLVPQASAQGARPVRSQVPRMLRAPQNARVPAELLRLPRAAPVAVYAPHLQHAVRDLRDAIALAGDVLPMLEGVDLGQAAARALWGPTAGLAWAAGGSQAIWEQFGTDEGLRSMGLDPRAPVTVVWRPELGMTVVSFGLQSRPKFERWLDQIGGGQGRTRIPLGGEQASVLAPDAATPVTCLARQNRAACQFGVASGPDPLSGLRTAARGSPNTWSQVPEVARAYAKLPDGARSYALLNPRAIARWISQEQHSQTVRSRRFHAPRLRQQALAQVQARARKMQHIARKMQGSALGLYRTSSGLTVRMETALSRSGARSLQPHLRPFGEHTQLTRWAHTPALMQVILRTNPRTTAWILRALQLDLPRAALTGDLALLTLGVDTECPMAKEKSGAPQPELSWAFLLPSAAAVGLAGPRAADVVHQSLASRFQIEPGDASDAHRARIQGRFAGSPYELDVLDHIMLVGAGHGSGPAALRRLKTRSVRPARMQPPVFEASMDLHAVQAAFASGTFDAERRDDLLTLGAMQASLRPLLEYVSRVQASAYARDQGRRLSVELKTQR